MNIGAATNTQLMQRMRAGIDRQQRIATERNNPEELRTASQDFESILLTTLFSSLQESFSSYDGSDPAAESLRDAGVQQLAAAVSKRGGFGLSRIMERALSST